MRIHGKIKIKRSTNIELKQHYSQYLELLKKDFGHICGYCGKSEKVTKNAFEIDHFIPRSLAAELEHNYQNLVYSCFICNRKKGNKWPTKDKLKSNNGKIGLIDPASDEYDLHLIRRENDIIEGDSDIGKYMCKNIFKFDMRPIRELWLCSEIISKQEALQEKIKSMSQPECNQYIILDIELKKLQQLLFSKKE